MSTAGDRFAEQATSISRLETKKGWFPKSKTGDGLSNPG
jgi:hypothetical protein